MSSSSTFHARAAAGSAPHGPDDAATPAAAAGGWTLSPFASFPMSSPVPSVNFGAASPILNDGVPGTVVFNSIGGSLIDSWPPNEGETAQSFSTGSGSTTVADVQLSLQSIGGGGGTVDIDLYSDSSTSPGTDLGTIGTIDQTTLTGGFATYDVPVTGAPTLTADTRYWIRVTASVDNVEWGATNSTTGTGVIGEFQDANGNINPDGGGSFGETFLMSVTTETACFAAGTRIRTPRGEVAVERLRKGDRVVTAGAAGRIAPVRWIGRRRLSPARHPRPWDVNPIRVRAGAIGPGAPNRDLLLSPDHALFLDGVLIRARDLLNGATVVQEDVADITYYHVELDRHDVLLAENLPAESFLDTGNRGAFQNGGAPTVAHPDFSRAVWARDACAPLVWEGPQLATVRARLAARAERIGWTMTDQPDLRLVIGRRTVRPTVEAGLLVFNLPSDCDAATLCSRTVVPAHVRADSIDARKLGVGIAWLARDGVEAKLDGPVLGAGWLAPEPGLRWTDGAATLRLEGALRLELRVAPLLRYWVAPEAADAGSAERRAA